MKKENEKLLKKLEDDAEFENWCVEMGRKVNKGISEKLKTLSH